ncbi:MAG: DUF3015 domain-containing protein [Gammaproteobacteria bacterium]|nr:DUF3015 domain-containing protein [Gammaproteobacteria bacterium]
MKRVLIVAALVGTSSVALAEAPGGPNCGWGNMLMDGQSGLGAHVIASLTNGTSGNATFGMTTGTNGCSANGTLTYGGKSLVGAVMDEFSEDVARGDGEALTAVAVAMGVEESDRALFKQVMHDNFASLFPSADVTAEQVSERVVELMRANDQLARYVS